MQDRYVGDIGDFAKYALLRCLSYGKRLGVLWYLYPDEKKSSDGRHIQYLDREADWRYLDENLFDKMKQIVNSDRRSVARVKANSVLPNAVFVDQPLEITKVPVRCRPEWRWKWFDAAHGRLSECELIFADPDNGLFPDDRFRPTVKRSAKSIPESEVRKLSAGDRPVVVYHHNTRCKGGHFAEIANWQRRLPGEVYAYYWRRWSNRTFFVLNCEPWMVERLKDFAKRWRTNGELILPPE
ncbi:MAG: hypothetical protein OXG90_02385 [Gammaproteobacteria bacterium]|nr:hypothetical protein [Gammaproteobacteria bacterium]